MCAKCQGVWCPFSALYWHRVKHDAVLEGGAAEGGGFEELGDGAAVGLRIGGRAGWGDLCRDVVGDLALVSDFLPKWICYRFSLSMIEGFCDWNSSNRLRLVHACLGLLVSPVRRALWEEHDEKTIL
jgi:hypothetical protein